MSGPNLERLDLIWNALTNLERLDLFVQVPYQRATCPVAFSPREPERTCVRHTYLMVSDGLLVPSDGL